MLHADARAGQLAVARIVVFGLWFVLVAGTPMLTYLNIPPEVFEPVGVMNLLPVEQLAGSATLLVVLQITTLLGCALCVLGVRPWVPIASATWVLLLVHDGLMTSALGFTNHAQFALLYTALILAIFPAADALTVRARGPLRVEGARYAAPMVLGGLVITVAYAFVGLRRIAIGGLEVFTGDAVAAWFTTRALQYSDYGFEWGVAAASVSPSVLVLLNIGLFVVTGLEALSPLALRYPRFRAVWLAVMIPFHISTLFLMNIFFWENLVLLVIFVTPATSWLLDRATPASGTGRRAARALP